MGRRTNDELCELLLAHAWQEDVDDRTRFLLEVAAKRINRLGRRCLRLSRQLEVSETLRGMLVEELCGCMNDLQRLLDLSKCGVRGWARGKWHGVLAIALAPFVAVRDIYESCTRWHDQRRTEAYWERLRQTTKKD